MTIPVVKAENNVHVSNSCNPCCGKKKKHHNKRKSIEITKEVTEKKTIEVSKIIT
jgi:hypothetical protein